MRFKVFGASCAAAVLAAHAGIAGAVQGDEYNASINYDAWLSALAQRPAAEKKTAPDGLLPTQYDQRTGFPTFLWAKAGEAVPAVGPLVEKAMLESRAREYLRSRAAQLGLTETMIAEAKLAFAGYNGSGPAVAKFRQQAGGIEVAKRELNVMMDRSGRLVAISGYFAPGSDDKALPAFLRTPQQAISSAFATIGGSLPAALLNLNVVKGEYQWFSFPAMTGDLLLTRQPRAKRVYFPSADGALVPGYYVELFLQTRHNSAQSAFGMVISALDDSLLMRKNLVSNATYSYRVFADDGGDFHPFDQPLGNDYAPFTGSSPDDVIERKGPGSKLVTLAHGPISTGDPWIVEDGATTLNGNNTNAYLDNGINVSLPVYLNGFNDPTAQYIALTGDTRASNTGPNSFDHAIDADQDPSTRAAQDGANVTLFYLNNWLHDSWYDSGLDEASGNAQASNYGRGGEEADPVQAQGQDSGGRNNANMATPSDGSRPVMQMYLFDGIFQGLVEVTAPFQSGPLTAATASFGPQVFDITGEVAIANSNGCSPITFTDPVVGLVSVTVPAVPDPNLRGKIALIDRGVCNNTTKEQFAMLSGAAAMVNVNNVPGEPPAMGNADIPVALPVIGGTDRLYTTPAVRISLEDGQKIKDAIAAGQTVTMRLKRDPAIDFDGTLDHQVIAHEFFHYVSNRLVGNSSGLGNNQGGSMGEGWSDVAAMVLTVRPEDAKAKGNEKFEGAYGMGAYVTNNFFSGIRRVPYTTDFGKNAYTFKHIAVGEPTPGGGDGAGNAAVHASGEIWANMMWGCYAGLLNDKRHSFEEAQKRFKSYVIAGLKMTPVDPTYTEARDGVLAAALATDEEDFKVCGRGFAARGAGLGAVSPPRDSADHVGVVESYEEFSTDGKLAPAAKSLGGRFGGAFGLALLLPLLGFAALRRRA